MSTSPRELCEHLFGLIERFKHELALLSESNGLTRMQAFVLYSVYKQGDCLAMGKVAEALRCDASNITGIIDRLVAGGFIIRQENEHDRRSKSLRLTPKGQEVVEQMLDALPDRLGGQLSAGERDQLHTLLQKISS